MLQGIDADDWSIIRQVVVEVHDLDGRLEKVTALLKENGFQNIVVEQEPLFKGSEIYNLYALSLTFPAIRNVGYTSWLVPSSGRG